MKQACFPHMINNGCAQYTGVLLDSMDNFYTYQQSIPIYCLENGLNAIGQALLKKSRHQLFGDLLISKEANCKKLFPHIVFDCKGKIYAIMLLASPNPDDAVRPLDEHRAKP